MRRDAGLGTKYSPGCNRARLQCAARDIYTFRTLLTFARQVRTDGQPDGQWCWIDGFTAASIARSPSLCLSVSVSLSFSLSVSVSLSLSLSLSLPVSPPPFPPPPPLSLPPKPPPHLPRQRHRKKKKKITPSLCRSQNSASQSEKSSQRFQPNSGRPVRSLVRSKHLSLFASGGLKSEKEEKKELLMSRGPFSLSPLDFPLVPAPPPIHSPPSIYGGNAAARPPHTR